jgi:hypothetical protein
MARQWGTLACERAVCACVSTPMDRARVHDCARATTSAWRTGARVHWAALLAAPLRRRYLTPTLSGAHVGILRRTTMARSAMLALAVLMLSAAASAQRRDLLSSSCGALTPNTVAKFNADKNTEFDFACFETSESAAACPRQTLCCNASSRH